MSFRRIIIAVLAMAVLAVSVTGCFGGSNADTVSSNISKEAEKFKVGRHIVVNNSITDKTEFEVEGRCSWENPPRQLEVTCKDGPGKYTKATIGLGDNTTWASVQLGKINVSEYRTKIIVRPTSIVPDFDLVTGDQAK
jgi:hypothetical protein